ncbi:hypothetical protein ACO9S2_14045 [Nitrospira sp. NS4]|uniref:hypothetical protein n=1 Tax=Nitrospira sp. NS4 TaxID=3414498 RepID=UPI003C309642
MNLRMGLVLVASMLALSCSSTLQPLPDDRIETRLAAPIEQVKAALTQVLTEGGYEVDWNDDHTLTTGYRDEMQGPWNWLYRWRFGTIKSRVQASVAAETDQSTALKLEVFSEGKDGIFTSWEDVQSALPQSAENQLRLLKNTLKLL